MFSPYLRSVFKEWFHWFSLNLIQNYEGNTFWVCEGHAASCSSLAYQCNNYLKLKGNVNQLWYDVHSYLRMKNERIRCCTSGFKSYCLNKVISCEHDIFSTLQSFKQIFTIINHKVKDKVIGVRLFCHMVIPCLWTWHLWNTFCPTCGKIQHPCGKTSCLVHNGSNVKLLCSHVTFLSSTVTSDCRTEASL